MAIPHKMRTRRPGWSRRPGIALLTMHRPPRPAPQACRVLPHARHRPSHLASQVAPGSPFGPGVLSPQLPRLSENAIATATLFTRMHSPSHAPGWRRIGCDVLNMAASQQKSRGALLFTHTRRLPRLCPGQFAFSRDALMLFGRTLDAIFELTAIVREELGHLVAPARHIAADCGPDGYDLADFEFMRHSTSLIPHGLGRS